MDSVIFNTHDVILLMTIFQCAFFAALLLALGERQTSKHVFLALFLLSQAAIPLDILINFGAELRNVVLNFSPDLFYFFGFSYWLEGPLILWYIRSELYKNYRPKKHEYLYLIPFLAYLYLECTTYYSLTTEDKFVLQQGYKLSLAPKHMNYITLFREIFRLGFGIFCVVEIRRYRAAIRDNFSNIRTIDFKWFNFLVGYFVGLRIIAVVVALMILSTIHFDLQLDFAGLGLTANYLSFILVSILIFSSLRYSTFSAGLERSSMNSSNDGNDSFRKTDIKKLLHNIEKNKPYLRPSLTIDELSGQLKMESKVLSIMLNRHFKKNFYEFINSYRIDEAKRILKNPENKKMTITEVFNISGFNSKATFNTIFKKITKKTPSEYRRMF